VALGQRTATRGGRPSAKWWRRGVEVTNVSLPGSQAGGATTSRSELRGLTQHSSGRKALDGPAMRPTTPLAVENSVGKPAAFAAPNAGPGKRAFASGRTRGPGKARENLPKRRRCYKRHRWLVSEKQPESEEARPVALGQRAAKSGGSPSANR
jgi:hypothetical protein